MENHERIIKDAQYRKGLSIAFFNATNAAIELTKNTHYKTPKEKANAIIEIRDWLLGEHKKYYAETIAQVGVSYDVAESVKKLKSAKTLDELKNVWIMLSEDERRDEVVRKVAQKLKGKLMKNENPQRRTKK